MDMSVSGKFSADLSSGTNTVYNTNVHVCLMTLQQEDENANVRAAATYALANLLSQVAPPPTSTSTSTSTPPPPSSSSSSRRVHDAAVHFDS